jgi:transaldolase
MKNFLIDTANISYIKNLWSTIKNDVDKSLVRGITTNPNAFYKIDKLSLSEWTSLLPQLCELVSEIRQDNLGTVHVQCPNSKMTTKEIIDYAEYITKFNDGNTKISLKITPSKESLNAVEYLNQITETNVTGLSDVSTALKCITYGVNYVSIIPGRMEEVGIDAKSQVAYLLNNGNKNCEVITGSMRTIEGLEWVFKMGTLPTIGERVWDLMKDRENFERILNIKYDFENPNLIFSPTINETNTNLSVQFFEQMDKCGEFCYEDYKKL